MKRSMKGENEFERRLKRQVLKPVPSAWKEAILEAARTECGEDAFDPGKRSYRSSVASSVIARILSQLLWPGGRAWAALGAVWVLIIGVIVINRDTGEDRVASGPSQPSPLVQKLLREQSRLFVELSGGPDQGDAVETKRDYRGPRSRCDVAWREV